MDTLDNTNLYKSPYAPQLQDISQQRKYAAQLLQQGAQNLPGEMVSGHYVAPSWTQQLARVLQSGLGGYGNFKAGQDETALTNKYQSDMKNANQHLSDALKTSKNDPEAIASATSNYFTETGNPDDAGKFALTNAQESIKRARTAQLLQSVGLGQPGTTSTDSAQPNADGTMPVQTNTSQPNMSQTIGGVNRLAAGLTLSGDPTLEKFGTMVAKANEPLIGRTGGINRFNPQTNEYDLDPGSLRGLKDIESQKQEIEANHKVVAVPQADGSTRYMTQAQQIAETQPAVQGAGAGVFNSFTPREQAAIEKDAKKNGYSNYDVTYKQQNGQVNNGNVNRQSGQPGFSSGQTTVGNEMQKEQGKNAGELELRINNDANSAVSKIAQNNKMIGLLPSITTGPLSKQITTLKTLGTSLGVDIGDPSSNQEFEKMAIKGALESARQIYGGRLTNQDVNTQIASNPGSTMSAKAVYELIKYDNIVQQRTLDKQKAYFDWLHSGKSTNEFEMNFNQSNPFMGVSSPKNGQSAASSAPGLEPIVTKQKSSNAKLKANSDGSFSYGVH